MASRFWILDASGDLLLDSGSLLTPTDHYRFIFSWEPGERYRFGFLAQRGGEFGTEVVAPSIEAIRPRLRLCLPYTSQPAALVPEREISVAAVAESTMTLTAFVENTLDTPLSVTAEIIIPEQLGGALIDRSSTTFVWISRQKSERWHRQIPIRIPRAAGPRYTIRATATWTSGGESWVTTPVLNVLPRRPEQIAETVRLRRILMPTDQVGRIDRRHRPDTLILEKAVLNVVRRLLGTPVKRTNLMEPVSHQTVIVENHGEASVNVLVSSRIVDKESGETVRALAPPDQISGGTGHTLAFATLPGKSEQLVVLPLFLDWREAIPGTYQRLISLRLWGTDRPFLQVDLPLEVVEPSRVSTVVVCLALLLGTGLILLFVIRGKRLFTKFQTRELVFVALFATMIFSTVTVPVTILTNFVAALCGPFNVLVTGLLNEVVYYALLVAFLVLVPKPGAVALLIGVRFLLNGLILGGLSVPGFLYTATHLAILEAACFAARLTSKRSILVTLARGQPTGLWLPAVILGAADALMMWFDYLLTMQLYRLFYAPWYLTLSISVDGFLYTLLGVHLGARVGRHLGRIAP